MENEEILELVNDLYKSADGWELQTKIIEHNNVAELLKNKKLVRFGESGSAFRKTNRMFKRLEDSYSTIEIKYFKKDLLKYLVTHGDIKWGELEVKPNGVVLFKGVKANKLFLRNNKARKMLLYLILLKYATVDELFSLLEIENASLPDKYIKESEKTKNEFFYKYRKHRIKTLRGQSIDYLIEVFNKRDKNSENVVKGYAKHMFYFENDGYGLVDFDVAELMSVKDYS
jgi:hypothetical protein